MAQRDYVIGIDCSTTATKVVVRDKRGAAVSEGRSTFGLSRPQPAAVPDQRWRYAAAGLRHAGSREHLPGGWDARRGCLQDARWDWGGRCGQEQHGARFEPDESRAARYDRLYDVYRELYPSLRPLAPKLADALQDEGRLANRRASTGR